MPSPVATFIDLDVEGSLAVKSYRVTAILHCECKAFQYSPEDEKMCKHLKKVLQAILDA